MATEEQIKQLAYAIWEQEGHPEGKDVEHYLRAKQILEQEEATVVSDAPLATPANEPAARVLPPPAEKRKGWVGRHRRKAKGR